MARAAQGRRRPLQRSQAKSQRLAQSNSSARIPAPLSRPPFLDLPRSRPALAVPAPRSQHMHAYQIHVYRATVRPDAGRGVLHRNVVSDRHRRVGGQRSRRSGRQSPRLIRSVEDAAPGVAALPAHRLDREQHLLTIRTPRTTSSEIAVALWSSRTSAARIAPECVPAL